MRQSAVLAVFSLWLGLSAPARAQVPDDEPTWDIDLGIDLTAAVGAGLISVGWLLADELGPAWCAPECDPDDVNVFDRWAAGKWDLGWALASDIALYAAVLGNAAVLVAAEGFSNAVQDALVPIEAMFVTDMTAILSALASRRPRPYLYSTQAPLEERERGMAGTSFFSGHVGSVIALTVATAQTLRRRDPGSALPWVVLASGGALTLLAALGRVLSGNHFPSDVLIGIAMGVSMGLLFPALHE